MNILYICQYFPPEMGAPAARVSELAGHWSKTAHKVTVLTGFPNHPTGMVYPDYRKKLWQLIYSESVDGVKVIRTWLYPLPNRKSHERILNYSSFFLSSSAAASIMPRPDVLIATSPQLLVGLSGWWLSLLRSVPFVLEIRDLWPESITASGVGGQTSLLARLLSALSDFLYKRCDHLVVVTPAFKQDIINKYGIDPEKISIVENGVETDTFSPGVDRDKIRDALGLQHKFVVSYIGTLGLAHGLHTVVQAAERLKDRYPDALFLLVGEGADKNALMKTVNERGLQNVRFVPQQPRQEVPDLIRASDACLVLLKKAPVFETVIPTKMLEFLSCGRPVILGVDGQAREVLEAAQGGIAIEPESSEDLVKAVISLYHDHDLCEDLGRNGRRYIVENLSRRSTAERYIWVLERVVQRKPHHARKRRA